MSGQKEFVLLDANIWIAERLLQSSIGSAFLHSISSSGTFISLPEVVEREVNRALEILGERAAADIGTSLRLLKQLSGREVGSLLAPSVNAIREGIAIRWKNLSGQVHRIPFSKKQAEAALTRIIETQLPCGNNNEQFRDCCIWEAAIDNARSGTVHLITNDGAFYEGRNRSRGIAKELAAELRDRRVDVQLYQDITAYMSVAEQTTPALDEIAIGAVIVENATHKAREFMDSRPERCELGSATDLKIKGYAMPHSAVLAISFEVRFPLQPYDEISSVEGPALLIIDGSCDYNPANKEVKDVTIRGWTLRARRGGMFQSFSPQWEHQFKADQIRVIT